MSYPDDTRTQLHRRHLEDLRWILTREYWKQRELLGAEGPDGADLVDLPTRSYSRAFLQSLSDVEREQLLLIEEALARLDRGDYATCSQCGGPIEERRLEVAPWARFCAVCEVFQKSRRIPAGQRVVLEPAV